MQPSADGTIETSTTPKVTKPRPKRSSSHEHITQTTRSRSRSPGRSPNRRRALNRSPSPHRYNTRSQLGAQPAEGDVKEGCCMRYCACLRSSLCTLKGIIPQFLKCMLFVALTYIVNTMCTYGKCNARVPELPSLSVLYNEKVMLISAAQWLITAVAFSVPLGQVVKGLPTDRGTLKYLCNAPAATTFYLSVVLGAHKLSVPAFESNGKELQLLFSSLVLITSLAVCIQWRFRCFGAIYDVAVVVGVFYLADRRLRLVGQSDWVYSTVLLAAAMCLTTYSLLRTMFGGVSSCAVKAASRGLVVMAMVWSLAYKNYPVPDKACFLNTAGLASIVAVVLTLLWFMYRQCVKASSAGILLVAVVTGVLYKHGYLKMPSKVPQDSLWYVVNMGCALDALFVLWRSGSTNFLGTFKPGSFLKATLDGNHDPRWGTFDLKFVCVRAGLLGSVVYCVCSGVVGYRAETLSTLVLTLLGMTVLYSGTRLFCLEKALTSSADIIDKRCSLSFMLWSLLAEPSLTILPLKYALTFPVDKAPYNCYWTVVSLVVVYTVGLLLYTTSTIQGHYLLLGQDHPINKCLTTLKANGDEKIPVSGLWSCVRYPFITGEIMVIATMALVTGFGGILVYLPLAVRTIKSAHQIYRYNKISPSFYGSRVWREYQQMVKYNVIPGIY